MIKKSAKKYLVLFAILLGLFVLFTVLIACIDVRPIGPYGSSIGFAAVNQFVFCGIGVHLIWYYITDWIGVAAILIALGFAAVGLCQIIKRRSIRKVDSHLLMLGLFYILVIALYLFFEQVTINYRPVILNGGLETSYPSSHTMIVVCIMGTASMQLSTLCPKRRVLRRVMNIVSGVFIAVTPVGRLISGVHWFTDIVGGLLLSAALIALYCAAAELLRDRERKIKA